MLRSDELVLGVGRPVDFKPVLLSLLMLQAAPLVAQDGAGAPIVFHSGTGDSAPTMPVYVKPPRPTISCDILELSGRAISYGYYSAMSGAPRQRLDGRLLQTALSKYRDYYCRFGRTSGPATIVIVDFARHSSDPRLYRVDLRSGEGLDSPIRVAHGIGSDPDDDGFATVFSDVQDSLTSSLGAAMGAEIYSGRNGTSLRLDGLEASNSQMRARDIVVHSYAPARRRYFNSELVAARGRPGSSEGCFVIEPDKRDRILETLENGGFLYAGFSGEMPRPVPTPVSNMTFASGTGVSAPGPASETRDGTPGNPPTSPISPAPAAPVR